MKRIQNFGQRFIHKSIYCISIFNRNNLKVKITKNEIRLNKLGYIT